MKRLLSIRDFFSRGKRSNVRKAKPPKKLKNPRDKIYDLDSYPALNPNPQGEVRLVQTKTGRDAWWSLDHVHDHPDWLFIFGENRVNKIKEGQKSGLYQGGTQACIRCEGDSNSTPVPNAIGLRTCTGPGCGYRDDLEGGYTRNNKEIAEDVDEILNKLNVKVDGKYLYNSIVLPGDGLGRGVAAIHRKRPTPEHLASCKKRLDELWKNERKPRSTRFGLSGPLQQAKDAFEQAERDNVPRDKTYTFLREDVQRLATGKSSAGDSISERPIVLKIPDKGQEKHFGKVLVHQVR